MRTLKIKAVILTDGNHYFIHGCDDETPQEMFKKMFPMWDFDPSKESAHYVELTVAIPEFEFTAGPVLDMRQDHEQILDLVAEEGLGFGHHPK